MDAPPVQYVRTSDGWSIAYTVRGEGPTLVFLPFLFSHAQVVWTDSSASPLLQTLANRFRVVYYDSRGQGLSRRGLPSQTSQDSYLLDLRAVIEKLGIQSAVLMGDSLFSHISVRFAAENPKCVSALALLRCGVSWAGPIAWFGSIVRQNWDHFLSFHAGRRSSEAAHLESRVEGLKARTTSEDFIRLMEAFDALDISDTLARLEVPSLVLHPAHQTFISQEESARTAALIKNGRLVVLNGANFFGDSAEVLAAIERLLAETPGLATADAAIAVHGLSAREIEVLRLLATGKSNAQIAEELVISGNTIRRHISNIFAKIGVENRTEAASYAHRHNLT